jgi:hypothetical protein
MKRILYLIIFCCAHHVVLAQHAFQGVSLSEALIKLDQSVRQYDISFVYDELEDFTVTKTIGKGLSLPDAVREVCGFYPVRVSVKGRDIFVECIQKDRTKLIGHLVGPDGQPVAYANIALFLPTDSIYIGGGVSNEAGDFVIPCGAERARVRISCVGFKTIEQVMAIAHVGTVRMQMDNYYLGGVTIGGLKPVIRNEADRLQYIVGNDDFARGLTAQELLSRVPMVVVTGGEAMILGKGPALFMLNGRIAEIGDETIRQKLWTLRSEDIERIEVISNPSGRDVRETTGNGYINIVMRRSQTLGWRGDVGLGASVSDDWSGHANGSVGYVSEKLDVTLDAHGRYINKMTGSLTSYPIWGDEVTVISDACSKRTDKNLGANLMLRYLPVENLELGGMLSWQSQKPKTVIDGTINLPVTDRFSDSRAERNPNGNNDARSLTAYCDWRFGSRGKQLSLTFYDYKKDDDGRSLTLTNVFIPYLGHPTERIVDYSSRADYHIQSTRIDMMLPFALATIDVGGAYTNIKNSDVVEEESKVGNMVKDIHDHDYQEKTKAAYISIHRNWDYFGIKAGLRYEHIGWTEVDGPVGGVQAHNKESVEYWLPSLSLSVNPLEGQHVNLSWGTSCLRPNFYDLNPSRVYKSIYEYSEGNPLLRPSRMSNIELSYYHHKGFNASLYYHHGSNMVTKVTNTTLSLSENNNVFAETKPQNIGRFSQTGLYLRYQHRLSDRLMAMAEGEAFYHDATTDWLSEDCRLHGWGGRMTVSVDWFLNDSHTLMANGRYQHWFKDYQGMTGTDAYGYFYFALRYALLGNRLRLSLVANDPFRQHVTDEFIHNSRRFVVNANYVDSEKMNHTVHTLHHSHYIALTATYSFGGRKGRHIHRDLQNTEQKRAERQ